MVAWESCGGRAWQADEEGGGGGTLPAFQAVEPWVVSGWALQGLGERVWQVGWEGRSTEESQAAGGHPRGLGFYPAAPGSLSRV